MSTGVTVGDDVIAKFNGMKLRKQEAAIYLYISEKGDKGEKEEIKVDQVVTQAEVDQSSPEVYHNYLKSLLSNKEPRFVLWDFVYEDEGMRYNKLCLVRWVPEEAAVKKKMLYAGSKAAVTNALVGFAKEVQATSIDEISFDSLRALFK
eukprot:c14223_g1_i1.p1 GENE.c14223_g1_i1~~c14223_g1_i1.p1  ORF type:complete len:166 (+),score=41.23 c14223_g1_i1:54-500(+)